jgi:hypothetical protein
MSLVLSKKKISFLSIFALIALSQTALAQVSFQTTATRNLSPVYVSNAPASAPTLNNPTKFSFMIFDGGSAGAGDARTSPADFQNVACALRPL